MQDTPNDSTAEQEDGAGRDKSPAPVGFQVQYWTGDWGPFAAQVVRVNGDSSVELFVMKPLRPSGSPFIASDVFQQPSGNLGHYYKACPDWRGGVDHD